MEQHLQDKLRQLGENAAAQAEQYENEAKDATDEMGASTEEEQGETAPGPGPSQPEGFSNLRWNGIQLDLVLKAIFFGCLFYLLSQPELYKMTKKCCKSVDGVLLHSIVFAVVYYVVVHFI